MIEQKQILYNIQDNVKRTNTLSEVSPYITSNGFSEAPLPMSITGLDL